MTYTAKNALAWTGLLISSLNMLVLASPNRPDIMPEQACWFIIPVQDCFPSCSRLMHHGLFMHDVSSANRHDVNIVDAWEQGCSVLWDFYACNRHMFMSGKSYRSKTRQQCLLGHFIRYHTINPRQTTGDFMSTRNPIDILYDKKINELIRMNCRERKWI